MSKDIWLISLMNVTPFLFVRVLVELNYKNVSDKLNIKGPLLSHHDSLRIGPKMHYYEDYK